MFRDKRVSGTAAAALLALAGLALPQAALADGQQQGMVVVRDPESGQLRAPTPAELKALSSKDAAVQPRPRPSATVRADGRSHVHLGDAGMVYSVATRDAEGKLVTQCVKGSHAAVSGDAAPAVQDKEHDHEHD